MSDLEPMRLRRQLIADELRQLERNEAAYRLLLHLCEMLRAWQMPQDDQDDAQGIPLRRWRELQQEKWRLYERFIAKFYRLETGSGRVGSAFPLPASLEGACRPGGDGIEVAFHAPGYRIAAPKRAPAHREGHEMVQGRGRDLSWHRIRTGEPLVSDVCLPCVADASG